MYGTNKGMNKYDITEHTLDAKNLNQGGAGPMTDCVKPPPSDGVVAEMKSHELHRICPHFQGVPAGASGSITIVYFFSFQATSNNRQSDSV